MAFSSSSPYLKPSLLLLAGTCAVIATVLGFEHIGGYIPCKLCLGQREPYYAAIVVCVIAVVCAWQQLPDFACRILLAIIGLLMVYAMVLGIQHAGVEWDWWEGPGDCGVVDGKVATDAGSLLTQLQTTRAPACDEAAGRFLGLSFAGWNVIVSLILSLYATKVVFSSK